MGFYKFEKTQSVPASLNEVWDFISSPKNLQRITPSHMGFEMISQLHSGKMYPGMIIQYNVSPLLGLKMHWVTEITNVNEPHFFVDEQRVGPYNIWHHEHHLTQIEGGVLMHDIIHYQPPFGFLGSLANAVFIRRQLEEIFGFRRTAVEEIFGVMG